MTGFRNNFLFLLFLIATWPYSALAQEKSYLVPPVQLLALKKMETNAYGLTIADKSEKLNDSVWKNAAYPVTAGKFARLPNLLPAAAQELHLRLLKLAAEPPQGTPGQDFITLKLVFLFERGQFDDVYRLIQKIPENKRSDEQNKIYADVLLLQDMHAACFLSEKESDSLFWQKLSAVCAAFNKEDEKAFLALDLLKEQNDADPFILGATDFFLSEKPLDVVPEDITPLSVAVWRKAGRGLSELKDKTNAVWFRKTFAEDETIPVEERLEEAEKLVQAGLIPSSKLRTFYQQVALTTPVASDALQRAFLLQKAAALSRSPDDNLQKQNYLKQGFASAKKSNVGYAFAASAKDVLETLLPELETLPDSADLIEAFALAGLDGQTADWRGKAEILFPISDTTANGWPFAELVEKNKEKHLFIPALETMIAYAEKTKTADSAFISKIDRLMLTFKSLGWILPDETWHYTSFDEGSPESVLAARTVLSEQSSLKPVGDRVLEALAQLDGSYVGLLNALSELSALELNREAAAIALQSGNVIISPPVKNHE